MDVFKSARWLIATGAVMLVFALVWTISSEAYDVSKATSMEIAAVIAVIVGLPLSWWSFRGQLLDEPAEVGWTTWRQLPGEPAHPLRRTREESRLEGAFTPGPRNQVVVITGSPGVGKTQLAAGYARARVAEGWPMVAWINAASHEDMVAGMLEFADALSLRVPDEGSSRALERLRQHPPTSTRPSLIIFDGVHDLETLRAYLPAIPGWRVIITCDSTGDDTQLAETETEVRLEPPESADLASHSGLTEELVADLGRLPLIVDIASATQREFGSDTGRYLKQLNSVPAGRLLGDGRDGSHYQERYPEGAAEVALVALREAGFDSTAAVRRMLGLLTVLAPGGVSRSLLYLATESSDAEDTLARLARWCLVSNRMDGDGVLLHELIRRVVADRLRAEGALPKAISDAAELLSRITFPEDQAWDRRGEGDQLIAHIASLSTSAGSVAATLPVAVTERVLALRQWATRQLSAVGDGGRAVELAESIRTECETLLGPDHPDSLAASDNVVVAYVAARRAADGIPLAQEVLTARERVLGADHQDTLASRYTLAYAHEYAGQLAEAAELYRTAYNDYARMYGPDNPQTITVGAALARVRALAPAQAPRHRGERAAPQRNP
jgi:hypothetical protein